MGELAFVPTASRPQPHLCTCPGPDDRCGSESARSVTGPGDEDLAKILVHRAQATALRHRTETLCLSGGVRVGVLHPV